VRRFAALFSRGFNSLSRRYGAKVEDFLEVYLKTPGLPQEDVTRALLARSTARRAAAERLMVKAQQGTRSKLLSSEGEALIEGTQTSRLYPGSILRTDKRDLCFRSTHRFVPPRFFVALILPVLSQPCSMEESACHRTPLEVWDRVAAYIPRYHLRTWLFVSAFYRGIAQRRIFSTVDLHLGEDQEHRNRALDFFDRVKEDSAFARKVKRLRLHWSYEEGDTFDLVAREFRS
jgi:hypothetical protein